METIHSGAWIALIIGGISGAGKSTAAQHIAHDTGADWIQLDHLRQELRRTILPVHNPRLHFLAQSGEEVFGMIPEELVRHTIELGQVVSGFARTIIAEHVAAGRRLVIEGDNVIPSLLAPQHIATTANLAHVRSVIVVEPDERVILERLRVRDARLRARSPAQQRLIARATWLYGCWLAAQAQEYAVPVLPPQPWATLEHRILDAAGMY